MGGKGRFKKRRKERRVVAARDLGSSCLVGADFQLGMVKVEIGSGGGRTAG